MPCIVCGSANNPKTLAWNVGQLCDTHYATFSAKYANVSNGNVVDDFLKVHVLLQHNRALCLAKMGLLSNELAQAKLNPVAWVPVAGDPRFFKPGGTANYVKLSRALEYYEGYCWFPASRALLGGLLSAAAFHKSQGLGFNKDPGAGKAHGEQSHRLQWHAIMRCMTGDFNLVIAPGWHHTPLQLFYQFSQVFPSAWATAMDAQGNPQWGNPDNVVADVLASAHVALREALDRRGIKFGGPTAANPVAGTSTLTPKDQALQTEYLALAANGTIIHAGGLFEKIISQVYTWEKSRTGLPKFVTGQVPKAAKAVYRAAAAGPNANLFAFKNDYKESKTNLLVNRHSPDSGVTISAGRAAASAVGFNVGQYMFNHCGAVPLTAARF